MVMVVAVMMSAVAVVSVALMIMLIVGMRLAHWTAPG
jgi:hypothetical protein